MCGCTSGRVNIVEWREVRQKERIIKWRDINE